MTTQTPTLARRSILTGAAALFGLAQAPRSFAESAFAPAAFATLSIVDRETGEVISPWRSGGRLFVAGETGKRYGLRVTNRSPGRVELVLSVDGVNVVSGQTASPHQVGYVLDPWDSYDVTGWRKSDTEVAAFTFSALPQSYAAKTGRPGDVGVIGMAAFREKVSNPEPIQARPAPPPPAPPYPSPRQSAPASGFAPPPPPLALPPVQKPFAAAPPPPPPAADKSFAESARSRLAQADKLGTAHGALEWSQIHHTQFVRASFNPASLQQIEYDSFDNLVARGIVPPRPPHGPRPFPGDQPYHYVPDPPSD